MIFFFLTLVVPGPFPKINKRQIITAVSVRPSMFVRQQTIRGRSGNSPQSSTENGRSCPAATVATVCSHQTSSGRPTASATTSSPARQLLLLDHHDGYLVAVVPSSRSSISFTFNPSAGGKNYVRRCVRLRRRLFSSAPPCIRTFTQFPLSGIRGTFSHRQRTSRQCNSGQCVTVT